jgi:NAD(P)-dependent dehydrogenase (short-subunit alcohol dehydrogenase family)
MDLLSMMGRRVVITGASSGIGRAMACRFAEAGARLVLVDVNEEGLGETCNMLQDGGSAVTAQKVDLTSKHEIDAFWDRIGEPAPDTLVNNAGVYPLKDYLEVDEEFLDRVLEINLKSVFWMSQKFIEKRIKVGGAIVNVSSIEALLPFKTDLVAYGVSKAGVIALTRSLARDYGKRGFRANVIVPGAIRTPGTESLAKNAIKQMDLGLMKTGYDFQSRLAMGRWGRPDEVACVALFLASRLSSYVQGAIVPVDGGFLSA